MESGGGFRDANEQLRREVAGRVIEHPERASLQLIRDLFVEESKWCRAVWGVSDVFPRLTELLLSRAGVNCLEDFLEGYLSSMDTVGECHFLDLQEVDVAELFRKTAEKLAAAKDEAERARYSLGKDLFGGYVRGTPSQGIVWIPPSTPVKSIKIVYPASAARVI